ncbi:MAG: hypothetical protein OEZ58_20965 [Gammaproteobacteria bacterium]|nr:hypothetical protein [Gammaproteobacteria bacterium]
MLSEEVKEAREMFMAVAVIEHHISSLQKFSTYELCEKFADVWGIFEKKALSKEVKLDASYVMDINNEIANSLELEEGKFNKEEEWKNLLESCGDMLEEDPEHVISWIFSSLYWDHLTQVKLVTAWFYANSLRTQLDLPIFRLSTSNLGRFLDALSGSGPPIYDGQTFYPERFS